VTKNILGLVAVLGLATGAPAQSAIIYTFDVTDFDVGFVLTLPELLTDTTTFDLSDFDSITPFPQTLSVTISDPLVTPLVYFDGTVGYIFFTPFTEPGTYCGGTVGCDRTAAIMTITESSTVPEPDTLALLGLGLLGLGVNRARRSG